MMTRKWTLANMPPTGHPDAPEFFWELYEIAKREQERQQIPERNRGNFRLYRGDHWQKSRTVGNANKLTINLFAANVQRTCANLTARHPEAEVVDIEGIGALQGQQGVQQGGRSPGMALPSQPQMPMGGAPPEITSAKVLTASVKKWWKDTSQQLKLRRAALIMEINGTVITKPYWDWDNQRPDIGVFDTMGFLPAPGKYEDPAKDMPYCCYLEAKPTEEIERVWGLADGTVVPSDVYSILGEDRETLRPTPVAGSGTEAVQYSSGLNVSARVGVAQQGPSPGLDAGRGLVVEIWARDYGTYTKRWVEPRVMVDAAGYTIPDPSTGQPLVQMVEMSAQLPYPGHIRRVILTSGRANGQTDPTGAGTVGETGSGSGTGGHIILEDQPNPNINPVIPEELSAKSYLWDRFPVNIAYSYEDLSSFYGFSAGEQVGDLNFKIDEIVSRCTAYVMRSMFPPLVIPKGCGITRRMLNSKPNLVLMPAGGMLAQYIRFLQVPQLPRDFFEVLNLLIQLFDRVYQIEDADRGVVPDRVRAAAAIVALQERNAVLMQDKISSIQVLCEEHGKDYISLQQQFGLTVQRVKVDEMPVSFFGIDFRGANFGYAVESGSTTPRTSLQTQDQIERYYQWGAVDRQALLEVSGIPGWQRIIERVGEGQLAQALQILVQAGLPPEMAVELQQMLLQPGQGPGGSNSGKPGAGAAQGGDRGTGGQPGGPRMVQNMRKGMGMAAAGGAG